MIERICSLLKMKKPALNSGLLFASGVTAELPVDGTPGYQAGCQYQATDGAAGAVFFINEGTESLCLFRPIGATNATQLTTLTLTSATPSLTRLFDAELVLNPATTLAVAGNSSLTAIRGCTTLDSGKSITAGYLYGTQGKAILDGATVAVGSDHVCGLEAQMSASGTTVTSGHVAILVVSGQNLPASSNVDCIYVESGGNSVNSVMKAIVNANYAFDLSVDSGTPGYYAVKDVVPTGDPISTALGATASLKVFIGGVAYYIPLFATQHA